MRISAVAWEQIIAQAWRGIDYRAGLTVKTPQATPEIAEGP